MRKKVIIPACGKYKHVLLWILTAARRRQKSSRNGDKVSVFKTFLKMSPKAASSLNNFCSTLPGNLFFTNIIVDGRFITYKKTINAEMMAHLFSWSTGNLLDPDSLILFVLVIYQNSFQMQKEQLTFLCFLSLKIRKSNCDFSCKHYDCYSQWVEMIIFASQFSFSFPFFTGQLLISWQCYICLGLYQGLLLLSHSLTLLIWILHLAKMHSW